MLQGPTTLRRRMPQTPNPSSLECPAPPIASRVVKLQASKDNAGVCVQEMLFSNRTTAEQLVYCGSHPVLDFFSEPEIILNVEISGAHDGTYVNQTIEVGHITYGELAFEAASAVYMAVEVCQCRLADILEYSLIGVTGEQAPQSTTYRLATRLHRLLEAVRRVDPPCRRALLSRRSVPHLMSDCEGMVLGLRMGSRIASRNSEPCSVSVSNCIG